MAQAKCIKSELFILRLHPSLDNDPRQVKMAMERFITPHRCKNGQKKPASACLNNTVKQAARGGEQLEKRSFLFSMKVIRIEVV